MAASPWVGGGKTIQNKQLTKGSMMSSIQNSIRFSEFRAIANNSIIDGDQKVFLANSEKKSGLIVSQSGEARTFSRPDMCAQDSVFVRDQLRNAVHKQLSKVGGDLSDVFKEIDAKLGLGENGDKTISSTPLLKRTITEVVRMVEDLKAGKPRVDSNSAGKPNEQPAVQDAQPQKMVQASGKLSDLERTYTGCDLSSFESIVNDSSLNEDQPVYYSDKDKNSLSSVRREDCGKRELATESGIMRANLLKMARAKLGVDERNNKGGAVEKDAFKQIKDLLIGKKWEDIVSRPLTKSVIAEVLDLIKKADAGQAEKTSELLAPEQPKAGNASGVKKTAGVPKASELNPEQKAFLKKEHEEYSKWFEENGLSKSTVNARKKPLIQWKMRRALDPKYQDEVFRLFGAQLKPIQGDGVLKKACSSTQKSVDVLGGTEEKHSARAHVNKESDKKDLTFGYQLAADATFCGGTLTSSGQEEALFVDMPAMNLAYLLREKYVELVDTHGNKLSPEEFPDKIGAGARLKYAVDGQGERKLKTWLGTAMPTYSTTTDGVPNEDGTPKLCWLLFTAASSFGGHDGSIANIDRGGFIETLSHRPHKPLDKNDPAMLARANAFFDLIEKECRSLYTGKHFLKEAEKFGYGAENGKKMWNEMMLLAQLHTGGKFDVLGENTEDEFKKLLALMKSGDYKDDMEAAIEDCIETTTLQHRLWNQLAREIGVDAVAHTNPGGTFFSNASKITLAAEAKAIQQDGGKVWHLHYGYGGDAQAKQVDGIFQGEKAQHLADEL